MRQLLALAILPLIGVVAQAHSVGTSYLHIDQASGKASPQATVELSLRDLEFAIGLDSNHDTRITWAEVLAGRTALTAYIGNRLILRRGEQSCGSSVTDLLINQHADGPYAVLMMTLTCPASGQLSMQSNLLFDIDDSHRTLLNFNTPHSQLVSVLTSATRSWSEPIGATGGWSALGRFIEQGIWHIWTGFDHLAFLLLLLLPLMRPQTDSKRQTMIKALRIVTAFTLAHSITLACAAFKYISLPSRWVEAAIAASIVMTGLMNLWPRTARFGVVMAFGFGLIHGLGFAAALAELTANARSRILPLIGFNLGVELGQLVVVAAFLPLLLLGRNAILLRQRGVAAGSLSVSVLGMIWLAQRISLF
jgi:HupE / UreJ protein